jgi:hypothetical protein
MMALAAFVSPTSPEILAYSKYVTGLARTNRRPGLNQNMQFGMWLFEGLRTAGLKSEQGTLPGEQNPAVQFPVQTLAYRSGTVTDITLLFAGALEAAGIRSGFMPLDGDMIAAFDLGITKDDPAAAALFSGIDKLLILGDEVWLPLSMGHFNEGFMAAWDAGIAGITGIAALLADENAEAEFFDLENAWGIYPPAPLPGQGAAIRPPDASALAAAADRALGQYIANEFTPKINALSAQIRAAPTPVLYNQLGMVYMRSGRMAEAKTSYERAAGMGSVAAMVNRGNIALQEKDGVSAERWFRQALALNPKNELALRGLEQAANAR